jgi:hypothetical protein
MSTSKLPFVVQPKREVIQEQVGSEEAGYISISRRGYLTSGEKAFMQQAIGSDETTLKIINIARTISNESGVSLDSAYADTVAILGGRSAIEPRLRDIETKYMEEFTDLLSLLSNMQTKEKLLAACCLLKYRVDNDIEITDVLSLHPDIIEGLAELYSLEEVKSLENLKSGFKESQESQESQEDDSTLTTEQIEKKPSRRRSQN